MRHTRLPATTTRAAAFRGDRADPYLAAPIRLSLGAVIAINAGRLLVRSLRAVGRHPLITLGLVVLVVAGRAVGPYALVAILAGLTLVGGAWRRLHRPSFTRFVGSPAHSRWVAWSRYRRVWPAVMAATGLTTSYQGSEFVPKLRRVVIGPYGDRLLVGLLAGQAPEVWEKQTDALAHTFRACAAVIRVEAPGLVWVELARTDPLAAPIPALDPPTAVDDVDFRAVPVGRQADGTPWTVPLLGSHVLIGGATGAGKGSVLWSLLRGLRPATVANRVAVWGIDPKGGMELALGEKLFQHLAYKSTAAMLALLDDAVAEMRDRQTALLGTTRLLEPSARTPLLVVVVDELAALTSYTDRDTKRRATDALQLLLSQGRAVGVVVVAALQDPGKDVLPFRDLFPVRVALRLVEDVQTDMILGRGARDRGAVCDRIPASLPGVGYVQLDGVREPVRVRAAHVTDDDIRAMIATELTWTQPPALTSPADAEPVADAQVLDDQPATNTPVLVDQAAAVVEAPSPAEVAPIRSSRRSRPASSARSGSVFPPATIPDGSRR